MSVSKGISLCSDCLMSIDMIRQFEEWLSTGRLSGQRGLLVLIWRPGQMAGLSTRNLKTSTTSHHNIACTHSSLCQSGGRASCALNCRKEENFITNCSTPAPTLPRRRPSRRPLKTFNRSQLPSEDKSPCADWVLFGQLGKVLRVDADHVKAAENTLGGILLQIKAGGEVNIACLDEGEWEVLRHSPRRRYKVVSKGKR